VERDYRNNNKSSSQQKPTTTTTTGTTGTIAVQSCIFEQKSTP